MKFRLDLLSTVGPLSTLTVLFSPDIMVESFSKRINAPGKMVFSMSASNPKATEDNLLLFRRCRLSVQDVSGYSSVWFGYIEDINEVNGRIEVICIGMLGFFAKRFTAEDENFNGQGSTEAFGLLSAANSDNDTGVTQGTGGVTSTKNVTAQGRIDLLKAWELLAQAHEAEFQINDGGEFEFVPSLGSDKSGSLHLIYRRDGQPGTNINSIQIGESGREMANRVYGQSSSGGGLSYQYDDEDSQDIYSVIAEVKQFNEAQNLGTLTSMTTAYGSQRNNPLPDFRISPRTAKKHLNVQTGLRLLSGITYSDIEVGDLVTITTVTESRSETSARRIVEIAVSMDENGNENMQLTISQAGIFITAEYLDANRVDDLTRRIKQIEQAL